VVVSALSTTGHPMAFVCAVIALLGGCFTGFLCVAHTCLLLTGINTRQFWLSKTTAADGAARRSGPARGV
jgi:hypothetical protein